MCQSGDFGVDLKPLSRNKEKSSLQLLSGGFSLASFLGIRPPTNHWFEWCTDSVNTVKAATTCRGWPRNSECLAATWGALWEKSNSWNLLEVWRLLTLLSRKTSAYFGMVSNGSGMVRRWPCPKCCYFKQPQLAVTQGSCSYEKFIYTIGSGAWQLQSPADLRLLSLTFSLQYPGTSQIMVVVYLQGSTWRRKHRRLDGSDCECWFVRAHSATSLCQYCQSLVLYRHVLTFVLKAQIQESLLLYKSYCNGFGYP